MAMEEVARMAVAAGRTGEATSVAVVDQVMGVAVLVAAATPVGLRVVVGRDWEAAE